MGARPGFFSHNARQYLADIRRYPILTREEERSLLEASTKGDPSALSLLVESNLPFVVRMAADLRHLGVPFEDLVGEGNLGLIEAARRFDPGRGTRFITYAAWWIRKSMLGTAARHLALVHSTRYGARQTRQLRDAAAVLSARLGRPPEPQEIGDLVGQSRERVVRALDRRPRQTALDLPTGEEGTHTFADFLVDEHHGSPEELMLKGESGQVLERALGVLEPRERQVIQQRFGLSGHPPMTLRATGRSLALSGERVRQIEQQAMQRLRRFFRSQLRSGSGSRPRASGGRRGRRLPAGASGPS